MYRNWRASVNGERAHIYHDNCAAQVIEILSGEGMVS